MARALFVILFTLPLFAEPSWRARKLEQSVVKVNAQDAAKAIVVDCTKGESVQNAIDKNASPLVIEIRGTCVENVSVYEKDITLRGSDPLVDGIQGVAATPPAVAAALTLRHIGKVFLENLSFSGTPGNGLRVTDSFVQMTNCRITNNTAAGMLAVDNTRVQALETTFSTNFRGAVVSAGSSFFCEGCTFSSHTRFAATSARHSVVSLLNSVVTGGQGIVATLGAYIDVDCISSTVVHPCSFNVSGTAALASGQGAVAAMFGTGDFAGNVQADDHAEMVLYGARQTATPGSNDIGDFATLYVLPSFETSVQSQLFGTTNASGFTRVLLRDQSTLAGSIQCDSAADAWLDPSVILAPGASVTGCEHASVP